MNFKSVALFLMLFSFTQWAFGQVVINEIMYNSEGDDVEFVELYNASAGSVNLSGWYLLDDNDEHDHCPLSGTLAPGAFLVVAGDLAQFSVQYPAVSPVNAHDFDSGGNGWSLGNGGDAVRVFDGAGQLMDEVIYDDGNGWPSSPDGSGPSLELLNPASDNALFSSWDPSDEDGGTPGEINSVFTENIAPTCKNGDRSVDWPTASDAVTVTVRAFDSEGLARVDLWVNDGSGYTSQAMTDDGQNGDATANDSIFTAIIAARASGTRVKYHAVATDLIGQQDFWPNDAPAEYHAYTVDYLPPDLRITEVLAVNDAVNQDASGEYDDWFEIHNADNESVNLGGMFVSNSLGSSKSFELPNLTLAPDEYVIIWADKDEDQAGVHADFKLGSDGESVALFETVDHGNGLIHGWKYGRMSADVSMGFPDRNSTAPEYLATPTPGASNETSELFSDVCINEFMCTSAFGGTDDWVEIYNRGDEPFDLSGCFLSDERDNNTKWRFPDSAILNPGAFLVIYEDGMMFGFSSDGDEEIMLTAPDSATGLDFYDFNAQEADKSEGRSSDGGSTWRRFNTPTRGISNTTSSVEDENPGEIIRHFVLHQNAPNPFNPSTIIRYSLDAARHIRLKVFNVRGQLVAQLVDEKLPAGDHTVRFDGSELSSGIYFCQLTAGNETLLRRMTLLK